MATVVRRPLLFGGLRFLSRTAADLPKDGRSALQGYFSVRKLYLLATALTHNANR